MPTPITGTISGSRAAAVLGLSEYATPVNVWLQIMGPEFCAEHGYEYPVFEGNAATRWGSAFESAIIDLTERETGKTVTDRERVYRDDYLSCHVDGIIDGALYEGKTTSAMNYREAWGEPGTDKIPVIYQIQVQHNMMLAGLPRAEVSVLVFPKRVEEWEAMGYIPSNFSDSDKICNYKIMKYVDYENRISNHGEDVSPFQWARVMAQMGYFHRYTVEAHPELQALLRLRYREFWENYVLTGTPPPVMNYDDVKALVREPIGTVVANAEITRLMAEYKNITSEIGTGGPLAKRRDQIKVAVLDWMRTQGATPDDESRDKWILRDEAGRKIAGYGRNKNGVMGFR